MPLASSQDRVEADFGPQPVFLGAKPNNEDSRARFGTGEQLRLKSFHKNHEVLFRHG